ncbi:HNH endonuclease family protein [Microbacterium sp. GXF0217]
MRLRTLWWGVAAAIVVVAVAIGIGVANPNSSPAAGGPASVHPTTQPSAAETPDAAKSPDAGPTPDAATTPSAAETRPPAASDPDPVRTDAPGVPALETLAGLATVSGYAPYDYDRDLFGQRWADVDRNGCDTRNDILGRDLRDPVFKAGTRDCKVLTGDLLDPYDGSATAFVSGQSTSVLVQIDHVVALGWAWEHGAWAWNDDQRTAFANDPANLVAAAQHTNQSKSASGPADWLPPEPTLRCAYVEQWVAVLGAYALGIDDRDREAARAVLLTC